MNTIIAAAIAATAMVCLGGCATITKGTSQKIAINTPGVPGAECTLTSSSIGTKTVVTPATITLAKASQAIAVTCTKRCYLDGTSIIASGTEAMTAGNIIAGGVIGLGIDAASGALNKYNEQNDITMIAIQGCRA